jgi:hypothetical protein
MLTGIEAAAHRLQEDGAAPECIKGADFALPLTDEFPRDVHAELETGSGFTVLDNLPVEAWGLEVSWMALCVVGTRFGNINVQNREGGFLLDVISKNVPVSYEKLLSE